MLNGWCEIGNFVPLFGTKSGKTIDVFKKAADKTFPTIDVDNQMTAIFLNKTEVVISCTIDETLKKSLHKCNIRI